MKKLAVALLALAPLSANAAHIISNAPSGGLTPTHCGMYFDGATTPVLSPVDSTLACFHDISGIAAGSHTAQATFIIQDPIWGTLEGPKSAPLAFTRPAVPAASPSTLRVAP